MAAETGTVFLHDAVVLTGEGVECCELVADAVCCPSGSLALGEIGSCMTANNVESDGL